MCCKVPKAVWKNAILITSPEVLRDLVRHGSCGVQGAKGRSMRPQEHKECSDFQEVCPADICRNHDVKGIREMGQVSKDLKLKVLKKSTEGRSGRTGHSMGTSE